MPWTSDQPRPRRHVGRMGREGRPCNRKRCPRFAPTGRSRRPGPAARSASPSSTASSRSASLSRSSDSARTNRLCSLQQSLLAKQPHRADQPLLVEGLALGVGDRQRRRGRRGRHDPAQPLERELAVEQFRRCRGALEIGFGRAAHRRTATTRARPSTSPWSATCSERPPRAYLSNMRDRIAGAVHPLQRDGPGGPGQRRIFVADAIALRLMSTPGPKASSTCRAMS